MKLYATLACVLFALSVRGAAADENDDRPSEKKVDRAPGSKPYSLERVSAVVDDNVILESEVVARAAPLLAEEEKQPTDPAGKLQAWRTAFRKALDQMVEEQLIVESANEAKLEVPDDEVQKAIDEVKRAQKLTDKQLESALQLQGTSVVQYKKDLKKQMLRLRAVNVLVRPRVQISDDAVRAKYDKLSGQSSVVTEVHIRHILVALPDKPGPADVEAARKRAGELVARVRTGEDFATLAKEASADAQTKNAGGDLGWYKRAELPTEWEEILFAMDAGEVRGPVQGPRGLHVFQLVDNKKETVKAFAEVKDQLKEQLYMEEMDKQTKVWIQELRKKAHVEVKM